MKIVAFCSKTLPCFMITQFKVVKGNHPLLFHRKKRRLFTLSAKKTCERLVLNLLLIGQKETRFARIG